MEIEKLKIKIHNKIYHIDSTPHLRCLGSIAVTEVFFEEYILNRDKHHDKKKWKHAQSIARSFSNFMRKFKVSEELYKEVYSKYRSDSDRDGFIRWHKKNRGKPYSRVDNRYKLVGGGGDNRNKIRIPSKKHKNRWKNFVRLFPKYQVMYNKLFKKKK